MTVDEIAKVIADYLDKNNLFLVDITISKDDDVEVAIESKEAEVKIENCIELDHIISNAFDRDLHDYSLTVTSAGLDQPFKVIEQYIKYIGSEVELVLKQDADKLFDIKKVSGGKIIGTIASVNGDGIDLSVMQRVKDENSKKKVDVTNTYNIQFQMIKSCRPVIKFK